MRSSTLLKLTGLTSLLFAFGVVWGANNFPNLTTDQFHVTGATATTVPTFDANKKLVSSTVTPTQLNLLGTATNANTVSTLVLRDGSGNFSAGTITAGLTGNADTATTAADLSAILSLVHGGTHSDLSGTGGTSQVLKQTSVGGNISVARLACADLSNSVASCSTDATNASNIGSGTLGSGRLPNPTASTIGGIESLVATSHQWINTISTSGVPSSTQPAFTDISGSIATSQMNSGTNASSTTFFRGDNTWTTPSVVSAPPTVQTFTSSTGTYNKDYTFIITSGNATVGATYTNNAVTFTVYATVASATQVVMSGSGAPAASGTLTKSGGTGDATLTFSAVLAPLYLKITMVGGGGGGGGSGTGAPSGGGTGGNTTWGSTILVAQGGTGGGTTGLGGTGGTASLSGSSGIAIAGSAGANCEGTTTTLNTYGGDGGSTALGGGARGGSPASAGTAPATNSGSGGAGAGGGAGGFACAGGGGAGGYANAIITSPAATYAWAVGAIGSAGGIGTGGGAGTAGALGFIRVEEFYQ